MERALGWPGGCRTHVSIALKYWPGDASRARCPKTTSSTSSCDTDREGEGRGEIFFPQRGTFLEIWEIEPSSRKVRVFSLERRDGGGIGARGCGAWGTRG